MPCNIPARRSSHLSGGQTGRNVPEHAPIAARSHFNAHALTPPLPHTRQQAMLKILLASATGAAAPSVGGVRHASRATATLRGGATMSSLYDFSSPTLSGEDVSMEDFKGKPVLICNVASL